MSVDVEAIAECRFIVSVGFPAKGELDPRVTIRRLSEFVEKVEKGRESLVRSRRV